GTRSGGGRGRPPHPFPGTCDTERVREALLGACAAAVVAAAGCGRPRRCPPRRWRRWRCRSLGPGPRSPPSTSTRRARTLPGGSWIASLASEPLHAGTAQPLVPRIEGVLANAVGASFAVFFARTFQEGAGFRLTSLRRRALSSPLAGRRRCHTGRPSPVSATDERGQSPQPERRP